MVVEKTDERLEVMIRSSLFICIINSGIYLLLVFNSQEQILKTIKVVKE